MASSAAKRYARAVLDLARERGTFDAWQADLARLSSLMTDPASANYFNSPGLSTEQKRAMLDRVMAEAQPEARNLAAMLLERKRLAMIPQLAQLYEDALRAERGIVVANVTTAEPLGPREQVMVRDRLSTMLGKQVELRMATDPEIIGGIVARVGDLLIDGSVINRLRQMRARLAAP